MADKVKFFTLKRFQSKRDNLSRSHVTPSSLAVTRTVNSISESKPRKFSASGIKELVQCALCLEVLHNPKMLPCQHTFCMACLSVYIADQIIFDCPICRTRIQVQGENFLENLPSNLYIDSLLQLVGINGTNTLTRPKSTDSPPGTPSSTSPSNPPQSVDLFAVGSRCAHCKTICNNEDITSCIHCKLKFCRVCWAQHLDDMRIQLKSIVKQLETADRNLEHKIEHYKDRCERIIERINIAAEEKIAVILEGKDSMLNETDYLKKSADLSALALKTSLDEARAVAIRAMDINDINDDNEKVTTFINLHQNAVQLLTDVSKWDTERFIFDQENFRLEMDSATPVDAESDDPVLESPKQNNPLESEENLVMHYRSRHFQPHFVWRKTTRPSGVGVSPWSNHLYVCGMDSHSVLVMERTQGKTVTRLSCDEMMCPVHIAFMKSLGEIYVTDKWKHCIHVFSKDGEYLRSIGQKGSRVGTFRSPEGIATDNASQYIYVVDTGNDRVQIIQPDGKFIDQIGVATKPQSSQATTLWTTKDIFCTELNAPTSVAVTNDRVIVLDSGNRRVKVYNKQDKNKIVEFGSTGQRKGQFRQPEVLAVDPMGYILVGDSGNCRVQVFKPTGQLVRVFGGYGTQPGQFGWISGIHVTKQLDIIISDTKNHNVNFF
ncbi:unnamed protein product [Arctia plantaginis]|uniref:RING-type domain-containing protein n=1 Tax=Arctia plantaginis TaxID=874455 RepID=A0A8S0Z7K2_ARCPL|nr:unnamed protein product [Arctia plantaginis]CAB3256990.1 unnamed protein product [Arctia plantaginis]